MDREDEWLDEIHEIGVGLKHIASAMPDRDTFCEIWRGLENVADAMQGVADATQSVADATQSVAVALESIADAINFANGRPVPLLPGEEKPPEPWE